MRIYKILLLLIVIIATVANIGRAEQGPEDPPDTNVAILNFTSTLPRSQTISIQNAFINNLSQRVQNVYIITQGDVTRSLTKHSKNKPASHEDILNLGSSLNQNYIIWGHAGRDSLLVYSATVKILDIKKNSIIYNKTITEKDFTDVLAHMPVVTAEASERVFYQTKDKLPHQISITYNYFSANDSFDDTIRTGYGCGLSYDYRFLSNNIVLGFDSQFYNVSGNKYNTDYAYVIPGTAHIGYCFKFWKINLIPKLHIGGIYNRIYYYNDEEKNSLTPKKKFLLLGKINTQINIVIYDPLTLICGYEIGTSKDNSKLRSYQAVYAGLQISFW